ncbi:MAG TPA: hypothetical protein EYQ00_03475 [Dehalococcoidia bacterium]|nr:hypothetical protein [Dehalococcoidia bacterium]
MIDEQQKWLVYCEDVDQLNDVKDNLVSAGINTMAYHSRLKSSVKSENLKWFKQHGGILLSIRCLDEGVDIPDITHALILASSQNPREFIQRRGRVLRTAPGKSIAYIYDTLVLTKKPVDDTPITSLLEAELARGLMFSQNAINKSAKIKLQKLAIELGIDPKQLSNIGLESDE